MMDRAGDRGGSIDKGDLPTPLQDRGDQRGPWYGANEDTVPPEDRPEDGQEDRSILQDMVEDRGKDRGFDMAFDVEPGGEIDIWSSGDMGPDVEPSHWPAAIQAEITLDGEMLLPGMTPDEGPYWFVIDTGAQLTVMDADLVDGLADRVELTFGSFSFGAMTIMGMDLSEAEAFIGWDLGGLLGFDLMRNVYAYMDYQGKRAWLFRDAQGTPWPVEVREEVGELLLETRLNTPWTTVGLGLGIEATMIPDTGSGVTILTQSVFDRIATPEMPRLEGYRWATEYGVYDSFVTRLPIVELGGVVAEQTWAIVVPDENQLFQVLSGLLGRTIDGFLGYPIYRLFFLLVDGPGLRYELRPYRDQSHIDAGEWHRVGLDLSRRAEGDIVEMVFVGSDAEAVGIQVGDRLTAIDGSSTSGWSLDELRISLRGEPGERRSLSLMRGEGAYEVEVLIEDLLP